MECISIRRVVFLLFFSVVFLVGLKAQRKEKRSVVRIETNMGVMKVALFDDTPLHRDNFLKLAEEKFYDGLLFHRVIKDFMIQAGDPNSRNAGKDVKLGDGNNGYVIYPEFDLPYLYHWRGALAAAREPDEINPDQYSSGCQFYIVWGKKFRPAALDKVQFQLAEKGIGLSRQMLDDYEMRGGTPHLDGSYTVFGEILEGLDVVEQIQGVQTNERDRPLEDVVITRMVVEKKSKKCR